MDQDPEADVARCANLRPTEGCLGLLFTSALGNLCSVLTALMDAPVPPPLPPSPPVLPTAAAPASSFPRQAATFSVVAPFFAIGIGIFLQPQARDNPWSMMILGLTSLLLIELGFVFGIVALVRTKRHGRQGILGKAIAGTCICGILTLLMLVSIPGLMKAAERAKEAAKRGKAMQRQRMEQRQQ